MQTAVDRRKCALYGQWHAKVARDRLGGQAMTRPRGPMSLMMDSPLPRRDEYR